MTYLNEFTQQNTAENANNDLKSSQFRIKELEEALEYIVKHNTQMDGPRGVALKALYGEEYMKENQYYHKIGPSVIHKIS